MTSRTRQTAASSWRRCGESFRKKTAPGCTSTSTGAPRGSSSASCGGAGRSLTVIETTSPSAVAPAAVPETPYVGPRPFERADAPVFFGREAEAEELMCRIVANSEVLLYSQSGAGKTSLINARLIPLLEAEGCEILPPVRLRQMIKGYPADAVDNVYVFHTLISWSKRDPAALAGMALKDYLSARERQRDEDGLPRPRVAIFDQFEELFTAFPQLWQKRKGFFEQLRAALATDSFLRVVLSMREDYIA